MTDWKEPYGFSIFCDDIRHEMGGKLSYMGVYGADMVVHRQFPITIPMLVIVVYYNIDAKDPDRDDVELWVSVPGEEETPSYRIGIPIADLCDALSEEQKTRALAENTVLRLSFNIEVSPIKLQEPGRIKVRIKRKDSIIRLGTLLVVDANASKAST